MGCQSTKPVHPDGGGENGLAAPITGDVAYLEWRAAARASPDVRSYKGKRDEDDTCKALVRNVQKTLKDKNFRAPPPFLVPLVQGGKPQPAKVHTREMIKWYTDRVILANKAGGPRCRLVWWKTIQELGRLPRWPDDAAHVLDAELLLKEWAKKCGDDGKVGGRAFCQSFFSHKWASDGPDDGEKATRLANYGALGSCSVFPHDLFDYYFFIDYAGIEQNNKDAADRERLVDGICMLPLYLACSVELVFYNSPEYERRAICRLERLLAYAYCFSPMIVYIDHTYPHSPLDPARIAADEPTAYELRKDEEVDGGRGGDGPTWSVWMKMTDPVEPGEGGAVVRSDKERKLISEIKEIVTKTPPLNLLWPVNQAITFENYMRSYCKLDTTHANLDHAANVGGTAPAAAAEEEVVA